MNITESIENTKCIVIKVGSVLLTDMETDTVKQDWLDAFAKDIKTLTDQGKRIVIVSSGGIALGRKALGISRDIAPEDIRLEQKQAASAVGQPHVFTGYYNAFQKLGMTTAQVLLTMTETENRRMHLNARATLYTLLDKGIVPIINENDTISTGEIRFGDNDRLSVRVAQMIEADLVILLSTIDGLYTADPKKDESAQHIPLVETITDEHITMAGDAIPGLSTGGMKSKIEAAQAATRAGIPLIVAKELEGQHTLFAAQENAPNARKRWIGTHMQTKGSLIIDDGAFKALKSGKSLLPIGVKKIEGDFKRGDAVSIKTADGQDIAIGLSAYNTEDAKKIIGKQSTEIHDILGYTGRDELIHRNDMTLN